MSKRPLTEYFHDCAANNLRISNVGASLLSFVPTYMTNGHHRKDGKCFEGKEPIDFVTRTDAEGCSRLSGGYFFSIRPWFLEKCFFLTVDLERTNGITGVPFGRTELSTGANGTTFCALLHRDGPVPWAPLCKGCPKSVIFMIVLNFCLGGS